MSDLEQSALAVYFANCQGIKSDPLPMLRKILALGEGDRRDAERYRWLRHVAGADEAWCIERREPDGGCYTGALLWDDSLDAAIDAAMTPARPESV